VEVPVLMGRSVKLKRAVNGVVLMHFEELCGRPLGSADYLALAEGFHTVLLHGVACIYICIYMRINNRGFPCGVATWCVLCVCGGGCIHIYTYIYIYIYICTLTHTHRCSFPFAQQP
jgi:hypothetical protein